MTTSIIPPRQEAKPTGLGINASYNSRIVKLINKKKQLKSSVIIDELPTIYFRGLHNLIATARSNKRPLHNKSVYFVTYPIAY